MAVAAAGAGAEIMDKVGARAVNKKFRLRNTGLCNFLIHTVLTSSVCFQLVI